MNLKNSKFFKRIQQLRRLSKNKLRKEQVKDKTISDDLKNVFKERGGVCRAGKLRKIPEGQGNEDSEEANEELYNALESKPTTGIIHFNNVCFRLKCKELRKPKSKEELPTITDIKGSICVSNSRYGMIGRISKGLGFKVVKESKLWNILWMDTMPGVELYKNMKRFQQVNHFPGMIEICRKDLLSRNLNRMLKLFPRDYKIFPKTWIFPADYGDALNYASNYCRYKPKTFIIKPDAGAQGRGIWLTNDLKTINPSERMICQTYINKPLLIDGYKFDLRVYTLITSVDPLRIFVYNEGLARFATNKYSEPAADNSTDLFMHLTNYSLNKRSSLYDECDNDDAGSKRKFSAINNWLQQRSYDVKEFWGKIDDIIIKTVLSAWPILRHNYHACFPSHDKIQACFEILGFDILVDSKLKPYILEVNHSPSFHMHEQVDKEVKRALIQDTLTLVSTVLANKKQIMREDRKRIQQRLLRKQRNPANRTQHTEKAADGQPISPLAQQVAWEESHLGDFRRIMPPHETNMLNYYCQFFALQNQASIFAETAASKKREEVSKKLRMELEEKRAKQMQMLQNGGRLSLEERRKLRCNIPRAVAERHRQHKFKAQVNWAPGFISDAEERLRRTWMQMRMDLLKINKIVHIVYTGLYNAGALTNADIINYPELYECLQNGMDIINEE